MKESTFFVLVGVMSAVSLTCGFLGWHFSRIQERKHTEPMKLRDLYEDNKSDDDSEDIPDDFTEEFLRFY